jgi:hypothetical protein
MYMSGGPRLGVDLQNAGLAPCSVRCGYRMVLERPNIKIGISLGTIARTELWRKMRNPDSGDQPAYVHGIHVRTLPAAERNMVTTALQTIMAGPNPEASWGILYPRLSVAVSRGDHSPNVVLAPGEVVQEPSSLMRSYLVPDAAHLLGEEITLKITYDSVVPQALTSFHISFPWLTQRCHLETLVHGNTDYFVSESHLVGDPQKEMATENLGGTHKFEFKSNQLILPESRLEIRWQCPDSTPQSSATKRT